MPAYSVSRESLITQLNSCLDDINLHQTINDVYGGATFYTMDKKGFPYQVLLVKGQIETDEVENPEFEYTVSNIDELHHWIEAEWITSVECANAGRIKYSEWEYNEEDRTFEIIFSIKRLINLGG